MDAVGIFLLVLVALVILLIESPWSKPKKRNEDEELGKAFKKVVDYIKTAPGGNSERK